MFLVGYFFTSGFYAIYPALETTEKIRVLIGISTDKKIYDLTVEAKQEQQLEMVFFPCEVKKVLEKKIEDELGESNDNKNVEQGVI